jgi:sorting nexin-4
MCGFLVTDLSNDYDGLANSIQGLAYLESGITEPLTRFEASLQAFSNTLSHSTSITIDPFLYHLSALLAYSHSFRSVLKLRDQKQLDFEELSAYLSNTTNERDRLAAGLAASPGLGSYFKSKVDQLRGADAEFGRESRVVKLDAKIKEVRPRVTLSDVTE